MLSYNSIFNGRYSECFYLSVKKILLSRNLQAIALSCGMVLFSLLLFSNSSLKLGPFGKAT